MTWQFYNSDGSAKQRMGTVPNINDLGDVVVSSAASGESIRYDGTNWVNNQQVQTGTTASLPLATSVGAGTCYYATDWDTGGALLRSNGSFWSRVHAYGNTSLGFNPTQMPWTGYNYIFNGGALSIGTGLAVNYTGFNAMISGVAAMNNVAGTVSGLTANRAILTPNFIFASLTTTAVTLPTLTIATGVTLTANTTGVPPANSVLVGIAATNATNVIQVIDSYRGAIVPGTVIAYASSSANYASNLVASNTLPTTPLLTLGSAAAPICLQHGLKLEFSVFIPEVDMSTTPGVSGEEIRTLARTAGSTFQIARSFVSATNIAAGPVVMIHSNNDNTVLSNAVATYWDVHLTHFGAASRVIGVNPNGTRYIFQLKAT